MSGSTILGMKVKSNLVGSTSMVAVFLTRSMFIFEWSFRLGTVCVFVIVMELVFFFVVVVVFLWTVHTVACVWFL